MNAEAMQGPATPFACVLHEDTAGRLVVVIIDVLI